MNIELFLIGFLEKFCGRTAFMFCGIMFFLSGLFFESLQYLGYIPGNPEYETRMVVVSAVMVIVGLGFILAEFDRACFMRALCYASFVPLFVGVLGIAGIVYRVWEPSDIAINAMYLHSFLLVGGAMLLISLNLRTRKRAY